MFWFTGYYSFFYILGSALNASCKNIESGTNVITGQSGRWSYLTISYSKKYTTAPVVVANPYIANVETTPLSIIDLYNDGFRIGVYNTTRTVHFTWIAVER